MYSAVEDFSQGKTSLENNFFKNLDYNSHPIKITKP